MTGEEGNEAELVTEGFDRRRFLRFVVGAGAVSLLGVSASDIVGAQSSGGEVVWSYETRRTCIRHGQWWTEPCTSALPTTTYMRWTRACRVRSRLGTLGHHGWTGEPVSDVSELWDDGNPNWFLYALGAVGLIGGGYGGYRMLSLSRDDREGDEDTTARRKQEPPEPQPTEPPSAEIDEPLDEAA